MTLTSQLWFQKILLNKPQLVKKSNITIENIVFITLCTSINLCFDISYGSWIHWFESYPKSIGRDVIALPCIIEIV